MGLPWRKTGLLVSTGWVVVCLTTAALHASTPTFTPSMTCTPTWTATTDIPEIWAEHFDSGTAGIQPAGWMDETDDGGYNAELAYSHEFSQAALTRTAEDVWGKCLSPSLTCDTNIYNTVEIRVSQVSADASWKVGIQERNSPWQYRDLCASQDQTGTYLFEYASVMGWSDIHEFYIQVTVEGVAGDYVVLDYVGVRKAAPTPTNTATRTMTPTVTQTSTPDGPTATPTMTPTPGTLTAAIWFEGFQGASGIQPAGWQDESDDNAFNAEIAFAATGESAMIIRTAEDVWGKVLSPALRLEVNAYPRLGILISGISPATSWKVNVLEYGTTNQWDLCPSQTGTGWFEFNYAQTTGLSGERRLIFQVIVEGAPGAWVDLDRIQVMGNRRQDGVFARVDSAEPDQISIDGTLVKIKGVNYYPSTHGWQKMWVEWEPEMIHAELARAQALGFNVVRTCIHYSEFGGAQVKEEMLAHIEELLYVAAKFNLQVEFAFFPYFRDYSPAVRQDMKDHVGAILDRFRDDGRIFGWGMTNELDVHVALVNGDMTAHPDALDWYADMASFMKSRDPNHLIIAPTSWPDTLRALDLSLVDVYTLHYYGTLEAYQGNIMRTRNLMAQRQCVKPILIEEFGLDFSAGYTETQISDYFSHVWAAVYQTDIAGGLVWLLNDTEQDGTPHLWGLYTAAGVLRDGAATNAAAYQGGNLYAPALAARTGSPLPVQNPVSDREAIILNSQLPQVEAKWTPVDGRAQYTVQESGVLIHDIVRGAETYGYGHIESVYAVGVDMDSENDLRINIKDVFGRWYAFLGNTPTGYQIRIQYDTPVKGPFVFNLKDYVPSALQTGQQYFTVAVGGVESMYCMDAATVLVENVSVAAGARPTAVPTPADTFWMESFQGTLWVQPEGWRDESEETTFNCHIAHCAEPSYAVITRTADDVWGKVLSPTLECDVSVYNTLEIVVREVAAGAVWQPGIQENGGTWTSWNLRPVDNAPGTFRMDIPTSINRSGVQRFNIQLAVEGGAGSYVILDSIRIFSVPPTPTPTATVSPTLTATPTLGNTLTQTPTPWLARGQVLAYPNPARNRMHFAYTVSGPGKVKIDIYKLTGERIVSIVEQIHGGAGQTLSTAWDARGVAAGIYFCRIVMTDGNGKVVLDQKKKVALIK